MIIRPYTSVGDLYFSDNRKVIRNKLNEDYTFDKKGDDNLLIEYYDYFNQSELFVYYDKQDNINAFEFYKSHLIFEGIDLLKIPYQKLINFFSNLDADLEIGYNDFTSIKYGIGGNTNDDPEDVNATVEAVIIFKEGYYH